MNEDDLVKSLKKLFLVIPVKMEPAPHLMRGIQHPFWILAPCFRRDDVWTPASAGVTTFYDVINFDGLVKSQNLDGNVKSSRCKARKS